MLPWSLADRFDRPSYTATSIHQTYVGKALFEHTKNIASIAAVASVSPIFRNSSLGPNLLTLVVVDPASINLFSSVFSPVNTLQFSRQLALATYDNLTGKRRTLEFASLFSNLITKSRYCTRSLKTLRIESPRELRTDLSLIKHLVALEQLQLSDASNQRFEFLSSLLNLHDISITADDRFDGRIFKPLSDLGMNPRSKLAAVSLLGSYGRAQVDHKSFQREFCNRLLKQDRLIKLLVHFDLVENDTTLRALRNAKMTRLEETENIPYDCLLECKNLKVVNLTGEAELEEEELVQLVSRCADSLEELNLYDPTLTGEFWISSGLVNEAFGNIMKLTLINFGFNSQRLAGGFSALSSLEEVSFSLASDEEDSFNGSCLSHLPCPEKLKSIDFEECDGINDEFFDMFKPVSSLKSKTSKFTSLEKFIMSVTTDVSDDGVSMLRHVPSLTELRLVECENGVSCNSILLLSNHLPKLKRLEISGCGGFLVDDVKTILKNWERLNPYDLKQLQIYNDSENYTEGVLRPSKAARDGGGPDRRLMAFCRTNYPRILLDAHCFVDDEDDSDDSEESDGTTGSDDDDDSWSEEDEVKIKKPKKKKSSTKPKPKKATTTKKKKAAADRKKKAKTTSKSKSKPKASKKKKTTSSSTRKPKPKSKFSKPKPKANKKAAPKKASGRRRQRGK